MIVFLDTTIFVAAFWKKHPEHEACIQLLSQSKNTKFITSQHAIVEYYSVMTRIPAPARIEPTLVCSIIQENILAHVGVHSFTNKDLLNFIKQASLLQIQGGNVDDFYHYSIAIKTKAAV